MSVHDREESIIRHASERAPTELAAFLDGACGDDRPLRERVEAALAATCAADAPTVKGEPLDYRPDEAEGQSFGRYKLLELLGEGGFGAVWLAEQKEPVRRKVALKIIKLGMDTKAVVARFEAERQALAMIDHPNIAKVLDAGTTETGRPYFVMELVRGIRITDYCDQAQLPTKERLDLFIKVCQAIQHAHQKGIIHRDIKPSNILVAMHDGVPVPKVIDFGIAKATQGALTDKTIHTQFQQFIGTPAYMSPEQAELSALDIDTRSDIYSLGVLLYELLTGKTPFESRELIEAGIDAMRRTIREKEPARPSTRLSTMDAGALSVTAKARAVDGVKLVHLVRGDLDWIVMKALEKDRARRYETANGLAVDLQRHLKNEPVAARPPTALYKLQKSVRRNRLAYGAATAVALALILGAIVSYRQAMRARAAENLANLRLHDVAAERDAKERARLDAEQVSKFLQEVFQSPDPGRDGRTVTVADTLDRAVRQLDEDLATQPERRAQFQSTLAATYNALGLNANAIPLLENARTFWASKLGRENPRTLQTSVDLVENMWKAGRNQEALTLAEETRALSLKALGPEHTTTLWAMTRLANVYYETGRNSEAVALEEQVLEKRRKSAATDPFALNLALNNLSASYLMAGRRSEVIPLLEEVRDMSHKLYGTNHVRSIQGDFNLAVGYYLTGHGKEALPVFEETVARSDKSLGPEHPSLILALHYLGLARLSAGLKEESLKAHRRADQLVRKIYGTEHQDAERVFGGLSEALAALGRDEERVKLWSDLFAARRKSKGLENSWTLGALLELAKSYMAKGELAQAKAVLLSLDQIDNWPEDANECLMLLGTIEAWLGERSSYDSHRRRMLARFGSSTEVFTAERTSKTCLLLPAEGQELRTAVDLAERAFSAGQTNSLGKFFFVMGALGKYRAGEWAAAAERAERGGKLAENGPSFLQALDTIVLAMARQKMSQLVESDAAFSKANEIIQRDFPSTGRIERVDSLFVHILFREARALIEPGDAPHHGKR